MSKRKPHNLKARIDRSCRALLATNHVAVVNIDPSGYQGMINYKSLKNIAPGKIGQAVCGIAHRWTIYLSVFCIDAQGDRYSKSIEVAPDGVYLSDHLEDMIEHCYKQLRDSATERDLALTNAAPTVLTTYAVRSARLQPAVAVSLSLLCSWPR